MLPSLLLVLFILVVIIQLVYWLFIFGKFAFLPENQTSIEKESLQENEIPVSVIIAARNEAHNLKNFLPKILSQDYNNFEVILINDASTDETDQIITDFQKTHKNLKVIHLEATASYTGNKKNALTKGIEAASNNHLLFSDADCEPVSQNWIAEMTSQFDEHIKIILGYGAYKKEPSFINKLIRYETLLTAIQYFSYTKAGLPYMGVGRNLAYKKELFQQTAGYESHANLRSGDDDLFINQIATKQNTVICFMANSFTASKPKKSFMAWFQQKRRHISTADHYKPIHRFLLGLFYFSQFTFWVLAILLLIFSHNWQLVTILVVIRLILHYIAIYKSSLKLNEKDLIFLFPILDFVLVFTQLGLFLTNSITKPKHW